MKPAILVILVLSISCFSHTYAGDTDSIWFAGQFIKIGSPKSTIFPRLAAEYNLSKITDSDQWAVSTKDTPPNSVGIILFEKERVSFINKDWGSYGEECDEAFQMLYQAFSNISEQGNSIATLNVGESKEPHASVKEITLQFSEKRFSISIVKLSGKPATIVFSEQLRK